VSRQGFQALRLGEPKAADNVPSSLERFVARRRKQHHMRTGRQRQLNRRLTQRLTIRRD
jgi:hypothetical protein